MEGLNKELTTCLIHQTLGCLCSVRGERGVLQWEKWHKNALKGHFTNRQQGKEVPWPEIPSYIEGREPNMRRDTNWV